ncbi:hypothetical protein ACTFIU_006898 [Dictyostelium citrinum]
MKKIEFENGYCFVGIKRGSPAKLYYEIYGNKEAKNKIIFLNGLFQPTTSFKNQINHFRNLDDFQICVYDNRGVGKSNSFTNSLKKMALDVIELVRFLNWKKVNFVGVSLGGSACLYIASLVEKELINSILVCGPWPGVIEKPSLAPVTMAYPYFITNRRKRIESWNHQIFSKNFLNSPSTSNPDISNGDLLIQKYLKSDSVISYTPRTLLHSLCWFVASFSFHLTKSMKNDIAKRSYIKIGVVALKNDYLVDFEILKKISNEINAWKLYISDSGHLLPVEDSDFFNSTIKNHIYNSNLINEVSGNNIIINSKL